MEKTTIPLILTSTARGWAASAGSSAKDQQLINGLYQNSSNRQADSRAVYAQKRSGSSTGGVTYASGVVRLKHYSSIVETLYVTSTALYQQDGTNLGTLTGTSVGNGFNRNQMLVDAIIGGLGVVAFVTTNGGSGAGSGIGWFLYSDATSTTFPTFVGNRTAGSPIIPGIASTTGIYKGQAISGTGIPADTRVLSVDSATQITMTANATSGAGTATTITKEALSKIIDADFPSDAATMAFLDGYFFVANHHGNIYQSAINDPSSWAAADVIAADYAGDDIRTIFRHQDYIVCAGTRGTIQYFYNAGNASGSVLSPANSLNLNGLVVMIPPVPFQDGSYCICAKSGDILESSEALYRLEGANSYVPVSDDYWSALITDMDLDLLGSASTGNKHVVLIYNGSSDTVIAYDPDGDFSMLSMGAAITSSFRNTFTKTGLSTSFTWETGNTWTDSSSAYTLTAQTQPYTLNNGASFIINHIDLIADTESSGTATLDITEDDYATWQGCGTFDMTQAIKRIDGVGWIPSNAAFRVTHSANTNFRAQALVVYWTPCGR